MLKLIDLGLIDLEEARTYQKRLQNELIAGGQTDYLIFAQHPPVITYGRSSKPDENILASQDQLKKLGIKTYLIERGGDVTYHSEKQINIYPLLNLKRYKTDVDWYLRTLEKATIQTLKNFKVDCQQISGQTGVWINSDKLPHRKITSIGIRISRWCTLHGLAINIKKDDNFGVINPCGLKDIKMTSIEEETALTFTPKLLQELKEIFINNLENLFSTAR